MQLTRWINSIPGNILCVLSKFSKSGDVWPTIPFYWVQETPWLVLCKSLLILGHLVVWPELWPKVSLPFWSVPFDRSRDEDFIVIFHEWTHLEHVYPYFFFFVCLFVLSLFLQWNLDVHANFQGAITSSLLFLWPQFWSLNESQGIVSTKLSS